MSFWGEIKRRKVFQVAVVYLVVAWVLVQIVATVEAPLNLPDWFDTAVIVLLAVGFPVAIVMSWAYDITEQGVVLTKAQTGLEDEGADSIEAATAEVSRQRETLPNSIAVLPFANLSPDPDNAYFAAGIHEAVLNELAKIGAMNVISRTSVLRYADTKQTIEEIGAELNVGTIMEGSVQYAANHVRITAQLISCETGVHLWSESYDREFSEIFAIQTDIATRIASALHAKLTPGEKTSLETASTSSPDAYALYLKALAVIGNVSQAETSLEASAVFHALLDDAIALDPGFALAYAHKAVDFATAMIRPQLKSDPLDNVERARLATELAEKALEIDPTLGLAYDALGQVRRFSWDTAGASEAFGKALELSPNTPQILHHVATFRAISGDTAGGLEADARRAELDPNAVGLKTFVLLHASRFEDAIKSADELVESHPGEVITYILRGLSHALNGNADAALDDLRRAERFVDSIVRLPHWFGFAAYAFYRAGSDDGARRAFERVRVASQTYDIGDGNWALVYLAVGDDELALQHMENIASSEIADGGFIAGGYIASNCISDPLLDGPRFAEVRARMRYRL